MKTPQWLVSFYRKWWAGVDPDVGEEIPRYMTRDELHARWEEVVINPHGPPSSYARMTQPIKARKALKRAKGRSAGRFVEAKKRYTRIKGAKKK